MGRYKKKTPLRSGSNAAPIPDGAITTFTSAATLFRAAQAAAEATPVDEDTSLSIVEVPPEVVPAAKRSRRRKTAANKEKESEQQTTGASASPTKEQGWKKFKSKESAKEKVNTNDGKEAQIIPEKTVKKAAKATGKVDHQFPVTKQGEDEESNNGDSGPASVGMEPLHLESAMPRRTDWTPPPKNTIITIGSKSSDIVELPSPATNPAAAQTVFQNLHESFGRKNNPTEVQVLENQTDAGVNVPQKRKVLDMIAPKDSDAKPSQPKQPSVKSKAPRKKPRTITELATAAYAPAQPEPEAPPHDAAKETQPKGNGKTTKKPSKVTKKKKEDAAHLVLFSPNRAMQQVANQDFVFGTSSQLVREQSPGLLRDLQAAIRESQEFSGSDPFSTPLSSDTTEPKLCPRLWNAAARDEDGRLLDLEVVDLVDSPEISMSNAEADPFGYYQGDLPAPLTSKPDMVSSSEDSFLDISTYPQQIQSRAAAGDNSPIASVTQVQVPKANRESLSNSVPPPTVVSNPSHAGASVSKDSQQDVLPDRAAKLPDSVAEAVVRQPKFELYTDAQLAREITGYGFKPVKRRQAMIALLTECWESKNRTALGVVANAAMSTVAAAQVVEQYSELVTSPKRPRGRPKKDSVTSVSSSELPPSAQVQISPKRPRGRPKKDVATASSKTTVTMSKSKAASTSTAPAIAAAPEFTTPRRRKALTQGVLEIPGSDSEEDPFSPSPEPMFSPAPIDLSLSVDEDTELSLTMSPSAPQPVVFTYITKAVTTAPRTNDPSNPSWHEKMLMYDSIVLEDLAVWLNSGHLTRVGYDREVSPLDVKNWCQSKSICCLWRVNVRGKERTRY